MGRKSRKNKNVNAEPERMELPVSLQRIGTKAAAAYARLSAEKDTDDSIQTQTAMLHQYIASREDLHLEDTYIDNGYSGTDFDRPGFMQMMDDVRSGKIQTVVVKDLSRFGRDFVETGYYIETILPGLNVNLVAINDNFDSSREEDRNSLIVPIKNMINEMYAKDVSRKTSLFFQAHMQKGDVKIGRGIYGYNVDKELNRMVPNEETAPIVRMIFRWYLMGKTMREISRRLEFLQIPTPYAYKSMHEIIHDVPENDQWKGSRVKDILKNHAYTGRTTCGRRKVEKYNNLPERKMPKSEWIIHEDTHEALLVPEDFETAQELLSGVRKKFLESRERMKPFRETIDDCFPQKIRCMDCHHSMMFQRHTNYREVNLQEGARRAFYQCMENPGEPRCCRQKVDADYIRIMVMDQLYHLISKMCDQKELLTKIQQGSTDRGKLHSIQVKQKNLQYKLLKAEEASASLYENYASGILEEDEFLSLKEHYVEEKKNLKTEIQETGREKAEMERNINACLQLTSNLEKYLSDRAFHQPLVDELVDCVEVSKDGRIDLHLKCGDMFQQIQEVIGEEG